MAHYPKMTPQAKERFLHALMDGATMTEAAEKAGVARQTPYFHIKKDPVFAEQVEQAGEIGTEFSLIPVAVNRARDGWDEPVFQGGKEVGVIKRFDNNLLWKLIQARNKKYRPEAKDLGEMLFNLSEAMREAESRVKG